MTPTLTTAVRPVGVSRGAASLGIAWLIGVAIAMLTGAGAVVILLAVGLVAATVAGGSGWLSLRASWVDSITTATVADVGDELTWHVHSGGRGRFHTSLRIDDTDVGAGWVAPGLTAVDGTTPRRGIHAHVVVRRSSAGRLGLVWWRQTQTFPIVPLAVAPQPADEAAPTVRSQVADDDDRSPSARLGRDEVDGIRQWRDGDELTAVHWPATLRSGELVVRQRLRDVDEQWLVRARTGTDDADGEAARVCRSLHDGVAAGARVSVGVDGGEPTPLSGSEEIRRWGAAFDPQPAPDLGAAWWQRSIRFTSPEPDATMTAGARWAVAAATTAPLMMMLTPLGYGVTQIAPVLAAVALGAFMSRRGAAHRRTVRQAAGLLAGVAVGASLIDLNSIDGVSTSLRFLLPQLLVTLVVMQGFECVDRRAGRVSLACSAMLTTYAAGIRVDGQLGGWVLVAIIGLAIGSQAVSRADRRNASPLAAAPSPGRVEWRGVSLRAATGIAATLAVLAVLAVVPVPEGPAQLTLPSWLEAYRPTPGDGELAGADGSPLLGGAITNDRSGGGIGGYPGFSPSMDTSLRGSLSDTVVLRVRAPYPDFWRGQTFTQFDGRTWHVDTATGDRTDAPDHQIAMATGDIDNGTNHDYIQTFYAQVDLPNIVFAASRPQRVLLDAPLWARPDGALRADVVLPAGSAYTVVSQRSDATAAGLRNDGDITVLGSPPEFVELPPSITARTRALARQLATGAASTYDVILAIQAWLAAHVTYHLDAPVPPAGADAVDDFLFESQQGFCEQIATATAMLLRSLGIPARVATGYVPSERDRVAGVWISRGTDAHAWVEVRFPSFGWVAFDPTASVPLGGDAQRTTIGGDLVRALLGWLMDHLAIVLLVALGGAVLVIGIRVVRGGWRRHCRGRWGLLQDRFVATALRRGAPANAPNAELAAVFQTATATALADALDRSAFRPGWTDDDDAFEHAVAALRELERSS